MFEPLKNYLARATHKLHVGPQAKAGMICTQARKVIAENYPDFNELWAVKKFQNNTLTIQAKDHSSASELRMKTQELLAQCQKHEKLRTVAAIAIIVL